MSGLRKAKKYDWKDSNMALFGSDTEKNVKKESAMTEPAWKGAGSKVGVQIWRIVKFKVTHWTKEDYGNFYSGDSYIILNTYQNEGEDKLEHDVHFWIGKESTQDEYGTAAYKTVELDTLLDGVPVQHRECEKMETGLFKSYFNEITYMEGGADTGFRRVRDQNDFAPRLFHFHGDKKKVVVKEIKRKRSSIVTTDVFILDLGLHVYNWIGTESNKEEKYRAAQYVQELKSKRGGKPSVETLDEADISDAHKFYQCLDADEDDEDDDPVHEALATKKTLHRVSDASGSMECTLVKEGTVDMSDFESSDVFIFDTQKECFVWIGEGTSIDERKNGLTYAHKYLMTTDHPLIPVTVLDEKQAAQSKFFHQALGEEE